MRGLGQKFYWKAQMAFYGLLHRREQYNLTLQLASGAFLLHTQADYLKTTITTYGC